ncbi:MAG: MobA/MobL family protein [Nitrososphaerota archaeon]|nr:MobA/MobL family protein [Nitrososphaerota archaeon]
MDVKIIGRSSGRSAVGASAYRSGEKLHSNAVKSAAYGSGSKLRNGEIVHDYTKKKGVAHSEIILPDNALEKYRDRETLWNAVELSEKRKDAQLARELIVALPREFNLEEQIKVMRQYIRENFVEKGMIADLAIHHNEGNPHAHIMLTTRNVTPDGFGLKNTEWNKKEKLLTWRKAWTNTINNALEGKGLDERIDHRTLKAQGLDQEPTKHLGYQATSLERQGIRTKLGDYNREITQRNQIRAKLMEANYNMRQQEQQNEIIQNMLALQQQQQETFMQILQELQQQNQQQQATKSVSHTETAQDNAIAEIVPNEISYKAKNGKTYEQGTGRKTQHTQQARICQGKPRLHRKPKYHRQRQTKHSDPR